MHDTVTLSGTVADVFAHRFTLEVEGRTVLADLGPKGAERVTLAAGDAVTIRGERKPSEIKVVEIARDGETIAIPHGPKPPKPHDPKPHGAKPHGAKPDGAKPDGAKPDGAKPHGGPAGAEAA